ncbi:autotransporter domain-containing protein [Ereboglobus luteus]|uniref:Autotransporter domain-containing protein n=1 Tax=Ereboglobus luteus TaxID=1796921 RepID=A0A2U8E3Z3_9BACT|nr:autotransporter domain-containing protein [Ereboglobus luteus]AWI09242.1 hypothetical protein CKA38_08315 [Ereboglobus luteus]
MIGFDNAAQLGSGTGGITFADSGTLRAASTVTGTLTDNVRVAAGKTAAIEVERGGSFIYGGVLSSAADSTLRKTGEGSLLLTGDSSANAGALAIDKGAVTLVETNAALGGKITVGAGATLGGVGAAGAGGSVKIAAGGILDAGLDSTQSGTLTVHNLEMSGGATLRLDLFKDADGAYQKSDRVFDSGTSSISGANTIDLTSFATGTFNLGNLGGLAAAGSVTLSGMTLPVGGRLSAELTNASGTLEMITTSDQSRVMTWKGGANSTWNLAEKNWSDGGSVNQFSYGDRIIFDDTSSAANREIFIDAGEVRIADMTVNGNTDYTFTGGGIHASADNVQPDSGGVAHIVGTGRLVKTGNGTLTLANGQNTFTRVELGGGVLAVGNGNQLTTTDTNAGIVFTNDATLRATNDLSLDNQIFVTSGYTGAVDSNGHDMVLQSVYLGTNAAFVKQGEGVATIEQRLSLPDTSALIVREGTVRVGADYVFSTNEGASIVVDAGAKIDLAGHSLLMRGLSGAGEVDVAGGYLIYNVDSASSVGTFAGSLAGSGTINKTGDGKWTLSGVSSFDGTFQLVAGELGLANNDALGTSSLTVAPAATGLSVEADGLNIANPITAGTGMLTIESNGLGAEFSGNITADTIALAGTGTLMLSGNNTIANMAINVPHAIARRAESVSGDVQIGAGNTLEFRGVSMGQVNGDITGNRVLFTSSTMALRGANTLSRVDIADNSRVSAASTGALGGIGSNITVRDGAWLALPVVGVTGGNMNVDGGALVFGSEQGMGSLALSGTLGFTNGGEIRLAALLPTGVYTAAVAYGGIANMPDYDPHQGGMFMVADIVNGDTLVLTAYNKALEPGKDIVVAFDALSSTMRAVNARISEEFITPLADENAPRGKRSLWFRAIGSFMEYGDDEEHIGYTDNTYTGLIGYDWLLQKNLMLGAYVGYSFSKVETSNDAKTDMDMPFMGVYAARKLGAFCVSADVMLGTGKADTERTEDFGNFVTGSHKLDTLGASMEVSYSLPIFASGEVRPSVGIHYMNLSFYNYAEEGKGAVRLDDVNASLLQGVVKIDASKRIEMPWGLPGAVGLSVGWRQNFRNDRTDAWATLVEYPDARIQIRGDKYDKNSVMAGLNIRMMLSKSMIFSLAYDYDCVPFGDQNNGTGRHTFNSSVRITW